MMAAERDSAGDSGVRVLLRYVGEAAVCRRNMQLDDDFYAVTPEKERQVLGLLQNKRLILDVAVVRCLELFFGLNGQRKRSFRGCVMHQDIAPRTPNEVYALIKKGLETLASYLVPTYAATKFKPDEMHIHYLQLSMRSINTLMRAGITTVGQLIAKTEYELYSVLNSKQRYPGAPGFGERGMYELKTALSYCGLSLVDSLVQQKRGAKMQNRRISPGFNLDDLILSEETMNILQNYFAGILQLAINEDSLRNLPGITPERADEIKRAVILARRENRSAVANESVDYTWLVRLLIMVKDVFYGELDPEFLNPTPQKAQLVKDILYDGMLSPVETRLIELCVGLVDGEKRSYRQCARALGYSTNAEFTRIEKLARKTLLEIGRCLVPVFAKEHFPDIKSCSLDYLGLPLKIRNALCRPAKRDPQLLPANTTIGDLTEKTASEILCYTSHTSVTSNETVESVLRYFGLSLAPKSTRSP